MKFKVHGVRGSVSNASPEFDRYGGNTSCYEIEIDDCQFVQERTRSCSKIFWIGYVARFVLFGLFLDDTPTFVLMRTERLQN